MATVATCGTLPIRAACVVVGERKYEIRYPQSPLMESMVRDTLGGEYPFLPFLKDETGIILDVGANIGCVSLIFGTLYPKATVYSFEPSAETFALLESNTRAVPNVRPFHFGLLDRDCRGKLFQGNTGCATNSLGQSVFNNFQTEEVTLRRASTFLAEHKVDRITLLKLDTEGAEVPILRDLEPFLGKIGAVYLEYHSERDRRELDHLLAERFVLYKGIAYHVHRGVLTYVAKELIASRTDQCRWEISRPPL